MTLNSKSLAAIVFVILFGGILVSAGLGWWETESTKVAATFTEGDFAGQANPADIRGSYTFGDVEKNFNIPASVLEQAFGTTGDPAAYPVKELEAVYEGAEFEVGTSSVRLFVAFYNNLPFDLSSDIYLPESAAALLRERVLTPERLSYLEAHLAAAPAAGADAPQPETAVEAESTPEESSAPAAETERLVKGKTTFGEILAWGLPKETIESVLGMPLPASTATTVKDFCTASGLSFETVKPALQAEIDKLP